MSLGFLSFRTPKPPTQKKTVFFKKLIAFIYFSVAIVIKVQILASSFDLPSAVPLNFVCPFSMYFLYGLGLYLHPSTFNNLLALQINSD